MPIFTEGSDESIPSASRPRGNYRDGLREGYSANEHTYKEFTSWVTISSRDGDGDPWMLLIPRRLRRGALVLMRSFVKRPGPLRLTEY